VQFNAVRPRVLPLRRLPHILGLVLLVSITSVGRAQVVAESSTGLTTTANTAPSISGTPSGTATVGKWYVFRPSASDADGDSLTFSIANKPAWASFSASTGRLAGTPGSSHVGTYDNIIIRVSDGSTRRSLPAFSISVESANTPPIISGTPATTATADKWYGFRPTASDADGDTLKFSIANKPAWATFSSLTGRLAGTPRSTHVGTYRNIVIRVSDGMTTRPLPAFSITVSGGNVAPSISGTPSSTAMTDRWYVFRPSASDADGDALTFSVANKPAWASFSASTGRLAGTPRSSHAGTYNNIVVRVSDGKAVRALPAFSITVSSGNTAPTISGTPSRTVSADQWYVFRPSASDTEGDTLTFSIANRPVWASFSASTGRLAGTPRSTHAGTYSNIVVRVSDGKATTSLPAFSVTVSSGNTAPTIAGTPTRTASVGRAYSFQPSASDADGDSLTFSIANRPAWAAFNPTNGRLSGTPSSTSAGSYSNISIRVSDGTATTALPAFSISVADSTVNTSATLSWVPPTLNTDGTPVRNLAGFRIYYGNRSGQYSEILSVPGARVTSAVIEGLAPATWYFAVRAYTTEGVESADSAEASKTIY
jgi:hypothetical protein